MQNPAPLHLPLATAIHRQQDYKNLYSSQMWTLQKILKTHSLRSMIALHGAVLATRLLSTSTPSPKTEQRHSNYEFDIYALA